MFSNIDPSLKSWIAVTDNSDFPIQNLPFGICDYKGRVSAVSIIGDQVIDLAVLQGLGLLKGIDLPEQIFENSVLNDFIGLGKHVTNGVRERLAKLLSRGNTELQNHPNRESVFKPVDQVTMLLPVRIGDYTDFYSSEQHAYNVGCMFRDPDNALLPNWKHIPVGYHGRASSITVSGTDFHRPKGQTQETPEGKPSFGPTKRLDFELEMGFITGKANALGSSISTEEVDDHIFGFVLFNDWSARDIQKWEYVPLGPFLAKNFISTMSPWIVTLEALQIFRVAGVAQDPEVLDYLKVSGNRNFDINLEVAVQPEGSEELVVSRSNFKHMYWNVNQQLAHHTINGCNIQVGDLYASGTISGPTPDSYGSMLELAWKGTKPVGMPDGTERKFINDGDTVTMRGYAEKDGLRIGFGEVKNKVLSSK
ncbi:MAG: fumarylacetoacetase [Marinoscillum sp.]|jgi:fumarylacetoacetase